MRGLSEAFNVKNSVSIEPIENLLPDRINPASSLDPSAVNLEKALQEIVANRFKSNTMYLAFENKKSTFKAVSLGFFGKVKRYFGAGNAAPKKVVAALIDKKIALLSIAEYFWKKNEFEALGDVSDVIYKIFYQAKKVVPIDLQDLSMQRFRNWEVYLSEDLKSVDIRKWPVPGTHDSGAYKIDFEHPSKSYWILNSIAKWVIPGIVTRLTVAQRGSFEAQLNMGIRFFDLRVSRDPNGIFYLTHTFSCVPLKEALLQITKFMESNSTAVVQLAVKNDFDERIEGHESELYDIFKDTLGGHLFEKNETNQGAPITYNLLMRQKQRVVALFHDPTIFKKNPSNTVRDDLDPRILAVPAYSFWMEGASNNPSDYEKQTESMLKNAKLGDGKMKILPFAMTPGIRGGNLEDFANKLNGRLFNFLIQNKEYLREVHVVTCDFPRPTFVYEFMKIFHPDILEQMSQNRPFLRLNN